MSLETLVMGIVIGLVVMGVYHLLEEFLGENVALGIATVLAAVVFWQVTVVLAALYGTWKLLKLMYKGYMKLGLNSEINKAVGHACWFIPLMWLMVLWRVG